MLNYSSVGVSLVPRNQNLREILDKLLIEDPLRLTNDESNGRRNKK